MKDERRHFFRKIYIPLYWKGCVWEGVGDRTELQHNDHMVITAFLSRSHGLLNRGPGGPVSLGHSPHSSIFSPTAQSGGPWGHPLLGAGSLCSILSPTNSNFLCTELYYCFTPTQFNLSTVKVIPLIPWTGCSCYLHRWISYFDISAGVNMQQIKMDIIKYYLWPNSTALKL